MNLWKVKIEEMKGAARALFGLIQKNQHARGREWDSIRDVLSAHLHGTEVTPRFIYGLRRALNMPVIVSLVEGGPEISMKANAVRLAADDLLRYLRYFWASPNMRSHDPIRLCINCGTMFLAQTANARSCGAACNKMRWNNDIRRQCPKYFNSKKTRDEFRAHTETP